VMVALSKGQAARQVTRLASVRPALAAAYQLALGQWLADPALAALGRPFVSEGHRSVAAQDELYTRGRTAPGPVVTYKRGGESHHNRMPSWALDVAVLLPDGTTSWSVGLLEKFARLMKAADARVRWGGDWPKFQDAPHFEITG